MKERVVACIRDVFNVRSLADETPLREMEEWDSLQHINLIVALEQEFDVSFTAGDIDKMVSVATILEVLQRRS